MNLARARRVLAAFAVTATMACAQVQIVYRSGGDEHAIVAMLNEQPAYDVGGKKVAVRSGGAWAIRPAAKYADVTGTITAGFGIQKLTTTSAALPEFRVNYAVTFEPDAKVTDLVLFVAWECDGRLVATHFQDFGTVESYQTGFGEGHFKIKDPDRSGHLRAYLLKDGLSVPGVAKADSDLTPFRAAIDAGDSAAANAWLNGAGKHRRIPVGMLKEIARWGDLALFQSAIHREGVRPPRSEDLEAILAVATSADRENVVDYLIRQKVRAKVAYDGEVPVLHAGVMTGNVAMVKQLLGEGIDINDTMYMIGQSPLDVALVQGDLPMARFLAEHGAKFRKGEVLANLLDLTVNARRLEMTEFLLDHGASVGLIHDTKTGTPVLTTAAGLGDQPAVKLLLSRGAKAEQPNRAGATALMAAAGAGSKATVDCLIEAGASLSTVDAENRSACDWALVNGHDDLAKELYGRAPLTGPAASRLLADALVFDSNLAAALLQQNVTLDPTAKDFDDVLDKILASGNERMLQTLLDRGFDPAHKLFGDWSMIALAKRYRQPALVSLLSTRSGAATEAMPTAKKLVLAVDSQGGGISPRDLGDLASGEAVVDVFIDHDGVPRAPVLVSATDPKLGAAAVVAMRDWRFNAIKGGGGPWRRAHIPFVYSAETAKGKVFDSVAVDELPVCQVDACRELLMDSKTPLNAAMVSLVIDTRGEVISSTILATTAEGIREEAKAAVRKWRYFPAKKDGKEVTCSAVEGVLLPGGQRVELGRFIPFNPGKPGSAKQPKLVAVGRTIDTIGAAPDNAIALVGLNLSPQGFPRNVRIVASSDSVLSKQAVYLTSLFTFESPEADVQRGTDIIWVADYRDSVFNDEPVRAARLYFK